MVSAPCTTGMCAVGVWRVVRVFAGLQVTALSGVRRGRQSSQRPKDGETTCAQGFNIAAVAT